MSFVKRWVLPFMVALSLGAGAVVAQQGPATLGGNTANPTATTSTVSRPGIAVTSTDGFVATNPTAATGGVPVQMSPRLRFRGNAWDTSASETVDWAIENMPASAATPTGVLNFNYSLNGAAYTNIMTLNSVGTLGVTQIAASNDLQVGAARFMYWNTRTSLASPQNGHMNVTLFDTSIGTRFKADALPTVSACGAGSPAVVAGSTPLSGAVTIGTTAVATCTITFNGAAFPSAPHCSGAVETTTAANARAMGYSASATVLTIVPSAAWADSSVVNWTCMSAK